MGKVKLSLLFNSMNIHTQYCDIKHLQTEADLNELVQIETLVQINRVKGGKIIISFIHNLFIFTKILRSFVVVSGWRKKVKTE